jgi:hypothetical protein
MGTYALLILGLIGALLWYRHNALKRFDADPAQHNIASMLVGLAARRKDVTEADLRTYLNEVSSSPANRRARVIHAVLLTRTSAAPELYKRVVEISRTLR